MTRILIIDDDPDVRTVMNVLMKKQGYEVQTSPGKEDAWTTVQSFQPSLILLDVLLSGADGRELCRRIKAEEETKHIPVIMFSAHPGAADNIGSYGADDFIGKPFSSEKIIEKVGRWVNDSK